MKRLPASGALRQTAAFVMAAVVMVTSLASFHSDRNSADQYERLYFPSGLFLRESSLGYRDANADYLWFRFIQYYGAFAKGHNNFRHFELLINGITTLDPSFVEAYHFASLVTWSDLGKPYKSIDILKRGILNNPDTACLPFQIGLIYYVMDHDLERSAFWYDQAAACSDATDLERRFSAFAHYRKGDELGSLQLWQNLYDTTDQLSMKKLAEKMISLIREKTRSNPSPGSRLQTGAARGA